MNILLNISLVFFIVGNTYAQNGMTKERSIELDLGQGLYNLDYLGKVWPSVGINYTLTININLKLGLGLLSFYSVNADFNLDQNGVPPFSLVARDAAVGPFIRPEEINDILKVGIKDLSSADTYKIVQVPLDLSLLYQIINFRRHRCTVGTGATFNYAESNYYREIFLVPEIISSDGSVFAFPFTNLSLQTEFRSVFVGSLMQLGYSLQLGQIAMGINVKRYNQFALNSDFEPFWNFSLSAGVKL